MFKCELSEWWTVSPSWISSHHRIMECFGMEGTLKPIQFHPLPWAETPSTRLLQALSNLTCQRTERGKCETVFENSFRVKIGNSRVRKPGCWMNCFGVNYSEICTCHGTSLQKRHKCRCVCRNSASTGIQAVAVSVWTNSLQPLIGTKLSQLVS